MNIPRDDAASALASIERTRRISDTLRGYAHAGDIVAAWGLVWLVCNSLTYFYPVWGPNSWPVGIVLASIWSVLRGRKGRGDPPGWRAAATAATTIGLLVLVALITGVEGPAQANALISIFVAAAYVWTGIWAGSRFAFVGLFIAAMVVMGWFVDREHLYLWMGIGGGGALLLTGLWLRRA